MPFGLSLPRMPPRPSAAAKVKKAVSQAVCGAASAASGSDSKSEAAEAELAADGGAEEQDLDGDSDSAHSADSHGNDGGDCCSDNSSDTEGLGCEARPGTLDPGGTSY